MTWITRGIQAMSMNAFFTCTMPWRVYFFRWDCASLVPIASFPHTVDLLSNPCHVLWCSLYFPAITHFCEDLVSSRAASLLTRLRVSLIGFLSMIVSYSKDELCALHANAGSPHNIAKQGKQYSGLSRNIFFKDVLHSKFHRDQTRTHETRSYNIIPEH